MKTGAQTEGVQLRRPTPKAGGRHPPSLPEKHPVFPPRDGCVGQVQRPAWKSSTGAQDTKELPGARDREKPTCWSEPQQERQLDVRAPLSRRTQGTRTLAQPLDRGRT